METTQLQEEVSSGKLLPFSLPSFLTKSIAIPPVEEKMEIALEQDSSWNFLPCSLPSFLRTPFTAKPYEEEMEVVQQSVPVTFNPEPETMNIIQQQHTFAMATSVGQSMDATWPAVATGIERPVTPCTLPKQQTMKISQHADACSAR